MDLNELVATITREVIRQMGKKTEKECVMILENQDCTLVPRILEHIGDVDLLFFGDDPGTRTPVRYILPQLSCTNMADLAAGRALEPVAEEVLRLLLSGTKVEIFEFEYRSYAETAPGPLYSLYESYEATLSTFGLKEFIKKQPVIQRFKKAVVTEKDIIQANNKGVLELRIPENANITPLAAECAKELNVKLLKS